MFPWKNIQKWPLCHCQRCLPRDHHGPFSFRCTRVSKRGRKGGSDQSWSCTFSFSIFIILYHEISVWFICSLVQKCFSPILIKSALWAMRSLKSWVFANIFLPWETIPWLGVSRLRVASQCYCTALELLVLQMRSLNTDLTLPFETNLTFLVVEFVRFDLCPWSSRTLRERKPSFNMVILNLGLFLSHDHPVYPIL